MFLKQESDDIRNSLSYKKLKPLSFKESINNESYVKNDKDIKSQIMLNKSDI